MYLTDRQIADKIANAFVQKYLEGYEQLPAKMRDYDNTEYRKKLASVNQEIEKHTRDEYKKAQENEALAYAVAEAVLVGLRTFRQQV